MKVGDVITYQGEQIKIHRIVDNIVVFFWIERPKIYYAGLDKMDYPKGIIQKSKICN